VSQADDQKLIAALDIGSSKVSAIIAREEDDGRLIVLGTGQRESRGVKRGFITDMAASEFAVREAVELAERMSGLTVEDVWASYGAGGLVSDVANVEVELGGHPVEQADIDQLMTAGKDAIAARANLGKMRLRVSDEAQSGRPAIAQLMISHPNDSGLAMDQVTRSYATPHFVRSVEVRYGGKLVMNAEVDFSISENPNFRFYFVPNGEGELDAKVVDNENLEFTARVKLDSARLGLASVPR